jgi:two-component system alkaline phosphatase synthesis response regulator PhoP
MIPSLNFQKALLIEDEPYLQATLSAALEHLKIPFEVAGNIREARLKFLADPQSFDLIFLDRMLPDGEGLGLCKEFRKHDSKAVIIILSALGSVNDRVQGLGEGADDYLPKPFSLEELTAKLGAYSRRLIPVNEGPEKLWDRNERELKILSPKGWVQLTKLEFRLASYLIRNAGKVVSREELLKNVWGFQLLPKTRTADLFVSRLKKHFEVDPNDPKHFQSIRGVGYRFDA